MGHSSRALPGPGYGQARGLLSRESLLLWMLVSALTGARGWRVGAVPGSWAGLAELLSLQCLRDLECLPWVVLLIFLVLNLGPELLFWGCTMTMSPWPIRGSDPQGCVLGSLWK